MRSTSAIAISDAALGDKPPMMKTTGWLGLILISERPGLGGSSKTACPFEPPIPELARDINDLPVTERAPNGTKSVGTFR